MLFSSAVFIFIFLPIVLGLHFILANKFRNLFILIASLFFYAWGEGVLVLLMMSSICFNYAIGVGIDHFKKTSHTLLSKWMLFMGVFGNLLVLGYFKYIQFVIENLGLLGINFSIDVSGIILPIGISFFTFQSLSYLVDVYRGTVKAQRDLISLGMYISLFPQLIAGPIVRYVDISKEIEKRVISVELFKSGINRFIIGFGKKIIIANNVGLIADKVFEVAPTEISTELSWLGIICYTLQIYFDFSGYSDMAIGLGKMLGFNFKENFEHPYISSSIREFWRRWHISLSTWFKDYLYIPLGGNRKGKYFTYLNLLIVFLLTGLWHGASWNFIIWGLFHGFFLIMERMSPIRLKVPILPHLYMLLVVMVGWVFFRSDDMGYAMAYLSKMFIYSNGSYTYPYIYLNGYVLTIIILGIVFSTPLRSIVEKRITTKLHNPVLFNIAKHSVYLLIFVVSIMELAQTTYNPFIYFRF